jgi:hypothetical protein
MLLDENGFPHSNRGVTMDWLQEQRKIRTETHRTHAKENKKAEFHIEI